MTTVPLSDEQKRSLQVENGVLIGAVEDNSPAAVAGIVKGDVLVSFDQVSVVSASQFRKLVQETEKGKSVAVLVHRKQKPVFVALVLPE